MLRQFWTRLRAWLRGRESRDEDNPDEAGQFARSSLDASVNYAHGEPHNGVRELQRASEYADELEDARRDRR